MRGRCASGWEACSWKSTLRFTIGLEIAERGRKKRCLCVGLGSVDREAHKKPPQGDMHSVPEKTTALANHCFRKSRVLCFCAFRLRVVLIFKTQGFASAVLLCVLPRRGAQQHSGRGLGI